jgi:predicted 2-oxoglutarate/Fe(II)-dependent dioxygenase YbiX
MVQMGGKTVPVHDPFHKRRSDHYVSDASLITEIRARVERRIVPEIAKAYQFDVTRMERYLVGCYRAEEGGHFAAHRDNTTAATAHRRFAVSINLNHDYDGGEIGFPEYGSRTYKPPAGGAVVFSCSLLHAVSPVTRGRRYVFLPFLHDDAAEQLMRKANAGIPHHDVR